MKVAVTRGQINLDRLVRGAAAAKEPFARVLMPLLPYALTQMTSFLLFRFGITVMV